VRQRSVAVGACDLSQLLARTGRGAHGRPLWYCDVSRAHGSACEHRRISTSVVDHERVVRRKHCVSVKILPIADRHIVGIHRLYLGSRTVLGTGQVGDGLAAHRPLRGIMRVRDPDLDALTANVRAVVLKQIQSNRAHVLARLTPICIGRMNSLASCNRCDECCLSAETALQFVVKCLR
jgi:hypothetical protein